MCENDFLLTYDPECLERHSDSSDFDNTNLQSGQKNYSILRRKLFRHTEMANYEREMSNKKYKGSFGKPECVYENHAVHPRQCTCNECTIPVEEKVNEISLKKRKVKYCNGDNKSLHRTPSRLSVVRSKIMPCLSSIFGRSNHSRHAESTNDKHLIVNTTKDNCCQVYCLNCKHRRFKKLSNKQDYIVQSMYSTEDCLDYSPDSGIDVNNGSDKDTILTDYNLNAEYLSPSSITANKQIAKRKLKKIVEREFRKAYMKKFDIKRTQEQQFPSKPNFKIFSTPKISKIENKQSDMRDINSFGCNVMPSNSSMFWEYLIERINKKYQCSRSGLIKSCHCTHAEKCPNLSRDPYTMLHDGTGSNFDYKTNEQATQGSNSNGTPINGRNPDGTQSKNTKNPSGSFPNIQRISPATAVVNKDCPPADSSGMGKLTTPPDRKNPANLKVQCKCHPGNAAKEMTPGGTPIQTTVSDDVNRRPCQEPHDQLKETLESRYNGEVLCIHNPPCILINGCLNLPPVKGQFSPTAWPVTQVASFHCGYTKSNVKQCQMLEQGCQYQPPSSVESQVYPLGKKTEKMTQSICNHDPPCEVVRCCYKPEFDPQLDSSCVHVPMCQKLPACVLNENNTAKCEHQPKCTEVPLCKRQVKKYVVMTTKDDISTQVKPNAKLDCKHVPPCIMIPKCLGKLMCEGYVPYEAIPDCIHQPACEMIPACCRKSAKMNSIFKNFGRKQRHYTST